MFDIFVPWWREITPISLSQRDTVEDEDCHFHFVKQRIINPDGSEDLYWSFSIAPLVMSHISESRRVSLPEQLLSLAGSEVSINGHPGGVLQPQWTKAIGYPMVEVLYTMFRTESGDLIYRDALESSQHNA